MENKKSFFEEEMLRRSQTVLRVSFAHDNQATLQDEKFIKDLIKMHDLNFYKSLLKRPNMTFSFGDKYFAPLTKNTLICIPKNSDTNAISDLLQDKKWAKEIEDSYKSFLKAKKFDGYFDISNKNLEY
jgi:hypothetical protein